MEHQRLVDWMQGDLPDSELTSTEIKWLEKKVFAAIATKMLKRPGVTTFPTHKTLQ